MPIDAQQKMKALVVSRLLLGDFNEWKEFEAERNVASRILNRRAARSASSQIGRSYQDLSSETKVFIEKNFAECNYTQLAILCDAIPVGVGLYLRLGEFEKRFFALAESVRRQFPFYAHVSISTFGLQFEYPEYHFLNDLDAGFEEIRENQRQLADLKITAANTKAMRDRLMPLLRREKFVSRSLVSAAFSLVESYLSGQFYTAYHTNRVGKLDCDENFVRYAKSKESAALADRIDRFVKFASRGRQTSDDEPFKSFLKIGKLFRDAIHHTTPFERKGLEAGERLEALYNVKCDVAVVCALLGIECVLAVSRWIDDSESANVISQHCASLKTRLVEFAIEQGIARPGN